MKLYLITAAPALLLASSAAFAQTPAPAPAAPVAPAAAPAAAATPAPAPVVVVAPPAPVAAPAPVAEGPVAAAPSSLDAAPPPVTTPPEAVPPAAPPDLPLAAKLGISKDGFWQPAATLQFWAFGANEGGDTTTTLRIRRAELRVKGEVIPKLLAFNVMIDPARVLDNSKADVKLPDGSTISVNNQGTVTILQDYNISFLSDYADVTVGQFKIPLSYEGYNSASKLLFPERHISSRHFGDQRDLGIKIEKKIVKQFYYQAAVFNGEGQNKLDSNAQKDGALRFELYPVDGLTVGLVGYAGLHNRATSATKDRLEADLKIDMSNFVFQAEYIHGWDGPTNVKRLETAGAYAAVGYTIMDKIQPMFRIGAFDSNVRADLKPAGLADRNNTAALGGTGFLKDEVTTYEFGVNYYLRGNDAKLQASWSKYVFADQVNRGEVILAAQAAF